MRKAGAGAGSRVPLVYVPVSSKWRLALLLRLLSPPSPRPPPAARSLRAPPSMMRRRTRPSGTCCGLTRRGWRPHQRLVWTGMIRMLPPRGGGDPSAFFCAHPFWAEPLPFQQFFDQQHEQHKGGEEVDQHQHQQHEGEDDVRGLWHQLPLSVRSAHEMSPPLLSGHHAVEYDGGQ